MRDMTQYQRVIDQLVAACKRGQGQISPRRARAGMWNRNATQDGPLNDQWRINQLLADLTEEQRDVVAQMLEEEFLSGVHETLVVLHANQIPPFEDGFEGDPSYDLLGRMDGWPWPTDRP